jgi:hypothetical protein
MRRNKKNRCRVKPVWSATKDRGADPGVLGPICVFAPTVLIAYHLRGERTGKAQAAWRHE